MSRNITFIILGLISVMAAYILTPSLAGMVDVMTPGHLPGEFIRMLQNNDLVVFAGSISLFGLLFTLLYIIFPVSYISYHINSAKTIIGDLPAISNPARNTDKKSFLSALEGLGIISMLAQSYGSYLVQGPEEEVDAEVLKKSRVIQKITKKDKNQKHMIAPVLALSPAAVIFNGRSLIGDNLSLGFFMIFSRVLLGVGLICLGISVLSFSVAGGGQDMPVFAAVQPGIMALLYCFTAAVIIGGLCRLADQSLQQNVSQLARQINRLFYQGDWPESRDMQAKAADETHYMEKLAGIIRASLDRPLKEISRAVDALTVNQEEKLDNILRKTLKIFAEEQEKKTGKDVEMLKKTIKDVSLGAVQMKKQLSDANGLFTRQMNKQAAAIARHLADMQKILTNSEKTTVKGAENIMANMAGEIADIHSRLGDFMDERLNMLDEKQKILESAVKSKNGILSDLHSSAKDLGTISNASGMLLERFISLATELDAVLKNIQEMGLDHNIGDAGRRDRLKSALAELKKANSDSIDSLPDM